MKKHIEKVLFVVLLALLGGSVMIALQRRTEFENPRTLTLIEPESDFSRDLEDLDGLLARLTDRPTLVSVEEDVFTPDVRVPCMNPDDRTLIPTDAKVCPYCGYEQTIRERDADEDTISDSQELAWGMNPNDPKDVHLDQDGDGFSTLIEFQKKTDPTDPDSHPPLIDYVRLVDVEETSIRFMLRGTAKLGGEYTLQLNWRYPGEDRGTTDYIKVGNRFGRNNEFLAESFTEKYVQEDNRRIDKSTALIRSGRYQVKLERDGDARYGQMTESSAELELIMGPDWSETVRVDQTIELDKKSYIIVDIQRESVVLKPDGSDKTRTIRKATSEELEALAPPEDELSPEMQGLEYGIPEDMMPF
ncbi:MAG: hypothetical protein PF795_12480 [Kiritimatiellae bacterium]|nr:hypothetical protein [Kiritimatiellia bacterium]